MDAQLITQRDRTEAYGVMRRIFEEGFATGNAAIVDELCSPDLVEHQFRLAGSGAEALEHVKTAIRDVYQAVPGMSFTIEDAVEQGDAIWCACGRAAPYQDRPSGHPATARSTSQCSMSGTRPLRPAHPDGSP